MLPAVGASKQQRVHCVGVKGFGEAREVGLYAVDPDGVGIDMEEGCMAQLGQSPRHPAAGAKQQTALVGDYDLRARAVGKMLLNCSAM